MGWQDRQYARDDQPGRNPLMWLVMGRVPLFRVFGIHVQAHASMLLYAVLVLLIGFGGSLPWETRIVHLTMLFAIVLLHEFGHCFAARWVGGDADEIIMTPIGGLALAMPPQRALPTFITVAAGPAVDVVICLVTGLVLWWLAGFVPWRPLFIGRPEILFTGWFSVVTYAYSIYQISWFLLLFNLLPIYPLDGGRMLQAMLWPAMGFYRSTLLSCRVGMIGSVIMGMVGLATWSLFLTIIAVFLFLHCMQMRRMMLEVGPGYFEDDGIDLSAAQWREPKENPRKVAREQRRQQKQRQAEQAERDRVDAILAKVSKQGQDSLNWSERRILRKATEHLRAKERR